MERIRSARPGDGTPDGRGEKPPSGRRISESSSTAGFPSPYPPQDFPGVVRPLPETGI